MKCPHCGKEIIIRGKSSAVDRVIEMYYRARAQGSKLTLKQLAEAAGISYSHLTKRKMIYDRAGKWGSKRHG